MHSRAESKLRPLQTYAVIPVCVRCARRNTPVDWSETFDNNSYVNPIMYAYWFKVSVYWILYVECVYAQNKLDEYAGAFYTLAAKQKRTFRISHNTPGPFAHRRRRWFPPARKPQQQLELTAMHYATSTKRNYAKALSPTGGPSACLPP